MDDMNFDVDIEALGELGAKLTELAPDALNLLSAIVDAANAGLIAVDEIANLAASDANAELDAKARKLAKRGQAAQDEIAES